MLLGVTEQSHTPEDPVVWVLRCLQQKSRNVRQVRPAGLLVDGTDIEPGILHSVPVVDGVDVNDGEVREEDLGRRFRQTGVLAVPASPVEVEPLDVDTFGWGRGAVLLCHSGDVVVHHDRVERPALVRPGHLLPHGRDEALGVEEAGHPEAVGPALEDPAAELGVSLQQLCVPEADRGRVPGHLRGIKVYYSARYRVRERLGATCHTPF